MTGWAIQHPAYFIELGKIFRSRKDKAHENALNEAQDGDRKLMKRYLTEENLYRLVLGEERLSFGEKRDILSIYLKNKK